MGLGSWLRDRPRVLEWAFRATHWTTFRLRPLFERVGYRRSGRILVPAEELSKRIIFDCTMCGQCVLHSTGMTCPMTCPKELRNGPCGGVRANGHCEVKPEMRCVWVEAFERAQKMPRFGEEILHIQPPVNRQLGGSSAWINMLTGADVDVPSGWEGTILPAHIRIQKSAALAPEAEASHPPTGEEAAVQPSRRVGRFAEAGPSDEPATG